MYLLSEQINTIVSQTNRCNTFQEKNAEAIIIKNLYTVLRQLGNIERTFFGQFFAKSCLLC